MRVIPFSRLPSRFSRNRSGTAQVLGLATVAASRDLLLHWSVFAQRVSRFLFAGRVLLQNGALFAHSRMFIYIVANIYSYFIVIFGISVLSLFLIKLRQQLISILAE